MTNKPCWKNRRRFMIAITIFCMGTISIVLIKDMQSSVAEAAVTMAFAIIGSTIASYVFGAVWEDTNNNGK